MNHQKSPIKWKFIFLLEPFWLMELPVDWEGQISVSCCFLKTKTCRSLMKITKRTGIAGIPGTVSQISLDNQKWSKGFELVFESANKLPIVQSYVWIPLSLDLNWWIPRLVFKATLRIIFAHWQFNQSVFWYSYFIGVLLNSCLNWRHSTHEWLKKLGGIAQAEKLKLLVKRSAEFEDQGTIRMIYLFRQWYKKQPGI